MGDEEVRFLCERHGFPRQHFGLLCLAGAGERLRPRGPPLHVRDQIVRGRGFAARLAQSERLVGPPLQMEGLGEQRRQHRRHDRLPHLLERLVALPEDAFRRTGIAGEQLDDPGGLRR